MMTGPQKWRITYPAFMAAMAVIGVVRLFFDYGFFFRNCTPGIFLKSSSCVQTVAS
jgi:hypothetical protein